MRVQERILTINLLEKIKKNPSYANNLGIEIVEIRVNKERKNNYETSRNNY